MLGRNMPYYAVLIPFTPCLRFHKSSIIVVFLFYSLFSLHNETINIWSHLLGFLYFFVIMTHILLWPPETVQTPLELAPIILQLMTYQVKIIIRFSQQLETF